MIDSADKAQDHPVAWSSVCKRRVGIGAPVWGRIEVSELSSSFRPSPGKLCPPFIQGPSVWHRLIEKIANAPRTRLTLVQAPAGFGKTTVLAGLHERMRERGARTAWLTLDASDNDYGCFLLSLTAAVKSLVAATGCLPVREDAVLELDSPLLASAFLASALASVDAAVVFIDDYQVIDDERIGVLMGNLVPSAGQHICWVIGTRAVPAHLPVARLRLRQELTEITMADLRLPLPEAAELLRKITGLSLDEQSVGTLHERTEGWVAALRIAAASVKGSAHPFRTVERFSAAHRDIGDFFGQEVLAPLPLALQRFLLETSVLGRLSVELCNFLTGAGDARRMLDRLETLNLFTFSLDEQRGWYRYHRLFAEFLKGRLAAAEPGRAFTLHSRASLWFEGAGHAREAIEHAILAKDFVRAASLLDGAALFSKGYLGDVNRYAQLIPPPILESFPNLQLERIYEWESTWEFAKARAALRRLSRKVNAWATGRELPPAHVDLQSLQAKISHREILMSFVADDMPQTERRCSKWFAAGLAADEYTEHAIQMAHMAAQREHYRAHESITPAMLQRYGRIDTAHDYGSVFHGCFQGMSLLTLGCLGDAQDLYVRAYEAAKALPTGLLAAAIPGLLLAEVRYEQDRVGEARDLIDCYIEVVGDKGFADKLISGHITRARIAFLEAHGEHDAARHALDAAERCARTTGFERLRLHVLAERIRQLALSGGHEEAFFWAKREKLLGSPSAFSPREGVTTCQELLALTWARVAALQGNIDRAQQLLRQWYQFTLARRCYRSTIVFALEIAAQLHARDSKSSAQRYVRNALRLGRGEFVRSFLDAPRPVRASLREIAEREVAGAAEEQRYAKRLLNAEREAQPCLRAPELLSAGSSMRLTGDLNRRELEILELAAEDLTNGQIAARLALSLNTVKWHWRAIFTKLCVHRRAKAVGVARETGMIF